jgi:hypothetical protein
MRLPLLVPVLLAALAPQVARASCPEPERPNDPICEPRAGLMAPGAEARLFVPRGGQLGPFVGGGLLLALVDWSTPRDTPGPGVGRLEAEVAILSRTGGDGWPKTAWSWGVGPTLSFEKNPSRRFLIPHYGVHLGGVDAAGLGHHLLVDGSLGLFLVQTGALSINASAGWVVPFHDAATLSGLRAQVGALIGWW